MFLSFSAEQHYRQKAMKLFIRFLGLIDIDAVTERFEDTATRSGNHVFANVVERHFPVLLIDTFDRTPLDECIKILREQFPSVRASHPKIADTIDRHFNRLGKRIPGLAERIASTEVEGFQLTNNDKRVVATAIPLMNFIMFLLPFSAQELSETLMLRVLPLLADFAGKWIAKGTLPARVTAQTADFIQQKYDSVTNPVICVYSEGNLFSFKLFTSGETNDEAVALVERTMNDLTEYLNDTGRASFTSPPVVDDAIPPAQSIAADVQEPASPTESAPLAFSPSPTKIAEPDPPLSIQAFAQEGMKQLAADIQRVKAKRAALRMPVDQRFVRRLTELGVKLAIAESGTDGVLSSKIIEADCPREVFCYGINAHSPDVKTIVLGVPQPLLYHESGASSELAMIMAVNSVKIDKADIGLSVALGQPPLFASIGFYASEAVGGLTIERPSDIDDSMFVQYVVERAMNFAWNALVSHPFPMRSFISRETLLVQAAHTSRRISKERKPVRN